MVPFIVKWISTIWLVFAIVWMVAAFASKRSVQRQTHGSRALHAILMFTGMLLIFNFWNLLTHGLLVTRLVPETPFWVLFGAVLAVAGILICFWARVILGTNWSGTVTIKQNHELVRRGPYAFVRHPIYTGLLTGMLGTAIVYGLARGFVGVFICTLALWIKSQTEEQFMVQQFGEQYLQCRQQVRVLIPYIL